MFSEKQMALAKIASLKITVFNAVAELQIQAERARDNGHPELSSRLALQAVALAKENARIRKAEDAIRCQTPPEGAVGSLAAVAGEARLALAALKRAPDLIAEAARLIAIVGRVRGIFR